MTNLTARSVTAAFSLAVVAKAALIVSCLMQIALLRETVITMDAAIANDARQRVISLSGTVIVLASIAVLLVWLFRAKKKLIAAGMVDAEYSPGFSVGCFFIPLVNLVMPFQAVRELWKASQNPSDWKRCPSSQIVGWWWAFWLLNAFIPIFGMIVQGFGEGREKMIIATQVVIVSSVASIVAFATTILLARGVSRNARNAGYGREEA